MYRLGYIDFLSKAIMVILKQMIHIPIYVDYHMGESIQKLTK